jgi:16S rRNA (adenine1518-N6/adenine1519-N6)-dimethyltransferase
VTQPSDRAGAHGPTPDLTDIGTLKRLLAKHGIAPNKAFGQHLLISPRALEAMLAAADLVSADTALEVGAGTGVLTVQLAERARRVVAVELDRNILPVLRETTAGRPNVEILARNLLHVAPEEVFGQDPYKLIANLPYYITSLTLRHFLEAANPPRLLAIMVQREVAERIVAEAGGLSLLGLSVQFYGRPRIVAHVPPGAFYPPPKVESAIVRIDVSPHPPLEGATRERFFALARAGFAEKRKQLHNNFTRHLDVSREEALRWLEEAGIAPTRRAQTLALDEWLALTRASLGGLPG